MADQRTKVDGRCVLIKDGALSMEMDGHILKKPVILSLVPGTSDNITGFFPTLERFL